MSAAQWRRAMNFGGLPPAAPIGGATGGQAVPSRDVAHASTDPNAAAPRWLRYIWATVSPRHFFVMAFVLLYPAFVSNFFIYQIGAQSFALGLIALSLTFLAGYGGMVSLAQMSLAGVAGYMIAIFGMSTSPEGPGLGWPWWLAVIMALTIATLTAAAIGWLSVRTEGIYTIMITLAIGVAFFYLVQQNYSIFSGFQGKQKVVPPELFGVHWRDPVPFYYLSLAMALAGYFFVKYLIRTPFGIALQGIRDNARRMNSLGFNVTAHRVAAYAVAGFIAAVGGILLTWYNGLITPGVVGTTAMINVLIIAVLGGMRHPIGAFVGAIVFVLLQNFAIDLVSRERFNLVIGGVFLATVLFSPDGLLGLWARLRARYRSSHSRMHQSS